MEDVRERCQSKSLWVGPAPPPNWCVRQGHQQQLQCPATNWAHGVVVSHPLSMREALGSIPSVVCPLLGVMFFFASTRPLNRIIAQGLAATFSFDLDPTDPATKMEDCEVGEGVN